MQTNHEEWKAYGRELLESDIDRRARMYEEEKHRVGTMLRVVSRCKQENCCGEIWNAFPSLEHEPVRNFIKSFIELPPMERMKCSQTTVAHVFRHLSSCMEASLDASCAELFKSLSESDELDPHIKTLLGHSTSMAAKEPSLEKLRESRRHLEQ